MEGNPRSILNWPMQSTGADILRLSCTRLHEAGIKICAPIHDAILIEATLENLEADVSRTKRVMQQACRDILGGRTCRIDAETVRYPDRYMDEKRGRPMWDAVMSAAQIDLKP
jgi:DNA polymerase-1